MLLLSRMLYFNRLKLIFQHNYTTVIHKFTLVNKIIYLKKILIWFTYYCGEENFVFVRTQHFNSKYKSRSNIKSLSRFEAAQCRSYLIMFRKQHFNNRLVCENCKQKLMTKKTFKRTFFMHPESYDDSRHKCVNQIECYLCMGKFVSYMSMKTCCAKFEDLLSIFSHLLCNFNWAIQMVEIFKYWSK